MKRVVSLIVCLALLPFLAGAGFPFSFWKSASGPNTYYYSQTSVVTPTDQYEPDYVLLGTPIVVAQAGTCTILEMKVSAAGAGNAKFALYDGSLNRVYLSGAVAIAATTGYKGVSGLSISVTPQTYILAMIDDGANMGWEVDASLTHQYGNADGTYSAGPPATFPANNTAPNGQPTARMFVQ